MAPKVKFTKQDIINAAFNIANVEGFDGITIRKIAKELGSSIAPIYVNFEDIDELKQAVVEKSLDTSKQIFLEQNSGHPFRDIGIASIKFALKHSILFRDLIMHNHPQMKYNEANTLFVMEQMKKDPQLEGFSEEDLREGLLKMQIFQTGLSVMAANDLLPEQFNEVKMIKILDDMAEDVFIAAHARRG